MCMGMIGCVYGHAHIKNQRAKDDEGEWDM